MNKKKIMLLLDDSKLKTYKYLNEYIDMINTQGTISVRVSCTSIMEEILVDSIIEYMRSKATFTKFNRRYKYLPLIIPDIKLNVDYGYHNNKNKHLQNKYNIILSLLREGLFYEIFSSLVNNKTKITYNELKYASDLWDPMYQNGKYNKFEDKDTILKFYELYDRLAELNIVEPYIYDLSIKRKRKGKFIVIEGMDSIGKTTLINNIMKRYKNLIYTREPGGNTIVGENIRKMLLDNNNNNMEEYTELLLLCADRNQHIEEIIIPTLDSGVNILADRYYYSTLIYQSNILNQLNNDYINMLFGNIVVPDLVVSLYVKDKNVKNIKDVVNAKEMDRIENNSIDILGTINLEYTMLNQNKYIEMIEQDRVKKNIHCVDYTTKNHKKIFKLLDKVLKRID